MASNETDDTPSSERTTRIKSIALALLAGLAVLDGAAIIYLRNGSSTPPPPPVATSAPIQAPAGPAFDVVRVDPEGNTVIAGRAGPGAVVTIKDNGNLLGTVTADAQGAFVFIPATPLLSGAHEITLSETLPDGTLINGSQSASVNLPGGGAEALTVLSGPGGSTVLSGQGPVPGVLGIGTVDYDANGHAIFSGTAPAGAKIELRLGNAVIGSTIAGANGTWRIIAPTPQNVGTLALEATTPSGAKLPEVTAPFAPVTLQAALAAGRVVIMPGDNLWVIARHVYGQGTMYTLIYTANAAQIHDPNLIFPGQAFVLPKPKSD